MKKRVLPDTRTPEQIAYERRAKRNTLACKLVKPKERPFENIIIEPRSKVIKPDLNPAVEYCIKRGILRR